MVIIPVLRDIGDGRRNRLAIIDEEIHRPRARSESVLQACIAVATLPDYNLSGVAPCNFRPCSDRQGGRDVVERRITDFDEIIIPVEIPSPPPQLRHPNAIRRRGHVGQGAVRVRAPDARQGIESLHGARESAPKKKLQPARKRGVGVQRKLPGAAVHRRVVDAHALDLEVAAPVVVGRSKDHLPNLYQVLDHVVVEVAGIARVYARGPVRRPLHVDVDGARGTVVRR